MDIGKQLTQLNFSELSDEELKKEFKNFQDYHLTIFSQGALVPPEKIDELLAIHSLFTQEFTIRNIKTN